MAEIKDTTQPPKQLVFIRSSRSTPITLQGAEEQLASALESEVRVHNYQLVTEWAERMKESHTKRNYWAIKNHSLVALLAESQPSDVIVIDKGVQETLNESGFWDVLKRLSKNVPEVKIFEPFCRDVSRFLGTYKKELTDKLTAQGSNDEHNTPTVNLSADLNYLQIHPQQPKPAIIGVGLRYPTSLTSPTEFWETLRNGKDQIRPVPQNRWDSQQYLAAKKMYSDVGGFLAQPLAMFDASFFNVTSREATLLDPQQRLLMETVFETSERAALPLQWLSVTKTACYVGVSDTDFRELLVAADSNPSVYCETGILTAMVAGRLSSTFDWHGPSLSVDTHCSSSMVAANLARKAIADGEADYAFGCGVNVVLNPATTMRYAAMRLLSPSGRCKPFDVDADGFVKSDGCAALLFATRTAAAEARLPAFAELTSGAINQDGYSVDLTSPQQQAQQRLIQAAIDSAQVQVSELTGYEAHGTGTPVGDAVEIRSLSAMFAGPRGKPLIISSCKSVIGHAKAAAGSAGIIRSMLQMRNETVPNRLHFKLLNKKVGAHIEIPVTGHQLTPQITLVSAFGISGTNANLCLTQIEILHTPRKQAAQQPDELLLLSAKTHVALSTQIEAIKNALLDGNRQNLNKLSEILQCRRNHFAHRAAATVNYKQQHFPADITTRRRLLEDKSTTAFLFPGHGTMSKNVSTELFQLNPHYRRALRRCIQKLQEFWPDAAVTDLFPKKKANRNQFEDTPDSIFSEPLHFAVAYALAHLWTSWGVTPDYLLGHSLGEYAAGAYAQSIDVSDALHLVTIRDRLTNRAGGRTMVVKASATVVAKLLPNQLDSESTLCIAAVNSPVDTGVSGGVEDMRLFGDLLAELGCSFAFVRIKAAAHCSKLLQSQIVEFSRVAQRVRYGTPATTVVSSVTGSPVVNFSADYLIDQLLKPVLFKRAVGFLESEHVNLCIGMGPTAIMLAMAKSTLEGQAKLLLLPSLKSKSGDWETLLYGLGQIYVNGGNIDFTKFSNALSGEELALINLPNYPFDRNNYWPSFLNNDNQPNAKRITPECIPIKIDAESAAFQQDYITIKKSIATIISGLTDSPDDSFIDSNVGFTALGMDSLTLVELQNKIEHAFPTAKLSSTATLDYPTMPKLATYLQSIVNADADKNNLLAYHPIFCSKTSVAVGIVGANCHLPGDSNTTRQLWQLLSEGKNTVIQKPTLRQAGDLASSTKAAFLTRALEDFDAEFFHITPREALTMDPQQRLLLEASFETIQNSCMQLSQLFGSSTGVFLGSCLTDHNELLSNDNNHTERLAHWLTGNNASFLSGRLSYTYGLQGPAYTINTACSSSLVAVNSGYLEIESRSCERALLGGINLLLSQKTMECVIRLQTQSPDFRCKTFDADADGYVRAEGCVMVVLSKVDGAEIDSAFGISAVAVNQDGTTSGLTVPNGVAQEALLRQVLSKGDVSTKDVVYIECHGSGTRLGDPIETNAISKGYELSKHLHRLTVSTIKTTCGHLEGTSGIAGLCKTMLSQRGLFITPHIHFRLRNPKISLEHALNVPVTGEKVQHTDVLAMATSSFGLSGTNAHAMLLRYLQPQQTITHNTTQQNSLFHTVVLSAKTTVQLSKQLENLKNTFRTTTVDLARFCKSLLWTDNNFKHRFAAPVMNTSDFTILSIPNCKRTDNNSSSGACALMMPGYGSEHPNMGKGLAELLPTLQSNITVSQNGIPPNQIIHFECALARELEALGVQSITAALGHNIGEFAVAATTNIISVSDACILASTRGRLVKQCPAGRLFAVHGPIESTIRLVDSSDKRCVTAAVNSDMQTVVCCYAESANSFNKIAVEMGFDVQRLKANIGQHSPQVNSMIEEYHTAANAVRYEVSQVPVVSSVTGDLCYTLNADYWIELLVNTVQFSKALASLANTADTILEVGAHPVLTSFKPIHSSSKTWLVTLKRNEPDVLSLLNSLCSLHCAGVNIDWKQLYIDTSTCHTTELYAVAPSYPFTRRKYWAFKTAEDVNSPDQTSSDEHQQCVYQSHWKKENLTCTTTNNCKDMILAIATTNSLRRKLLYWIREETAPSLMVMHDNESVLAYKAKYADLQNVCIFVSPTTTGDAVTTQQMTFTISQDLFKVAAVAKQLCSWEKCNLFLISTGTSHLNGNCKPAMPFPPLNGFCKSVNLECDGMHACHVNVDEEMYVMHVLVNEVLHVANESMRNSRVVYCNGDRFVECIISEQEQSLELEENNHQLPIECNSNKCKKDLLNKSPPRKWNCLVRVHMTLHKGVKLLTFGVVEESLVKEVQVGDIVSKINVSLDMPAVQCHLHCIVDRNITAVSLNIPSQEFFGALQETDATHPCNALRKILDQPDPKAALKSSRDIDQLMPGSNELQVLSLPRTCSHAQIVESGKNMGAIIAGGTSGLGLESAKWLLRNGISVVKLLGRRQLSKNIRCSSVVKVDCSDLSNLGKCVMNMRSHCQLKWVINSAVVVEEAFLVNQCRPAFLKQLEAKILGSWYLHRLTEFNQHVDHFLLYSSLSSVMGYPGQTGYASANAFQDALTVYRRALGLPGQTINWGPWADVGVVAGVEQWVARDGMRAITVAEGLKALSYVIELDKPQLIICNPLWHVLKERCPKLGGWLQLVVKGETDEVQQEEKPPRVPDRISRGANAYTEEVESVIVDNSVIKRSVVECLKVCIDCNNDSSNDCIIDDRQGFMDMGMDSLMVVDFRLAMSKLHPKVKMSAMTVFDHPNVDAMTNYLEGQYDQLRNETKLINKKQPLAPPPHDCLSVSNTPIVRIVSYSGHFPSATSAECYWNNLKTGLNAVAEVPSYRLSTNIDHKSKCGFLAKNIQHFDAAFFNISPKEATFMDPQQRLLLEVSFSTIDNAGMLARAAYNPGIPVYIGGANSDYNKLLTEEPLENSGTYYITGVDSSALAGRLSYFYGFGGPALTIDTACSSSLVAVCSAMSHLQSSSSCGVAFAGGVHLILSPPHHTAAMFSARMLSPDYICKTFDADADGFARAEACAAVLLATGDCCDENGWQGTSVAAAATNQDGSSSGLTAPSGTAQQRLLAEVAARAQPLTPVVVEAHGTGTKLGDPIEASAIQSVYSTSALTLSTAKAASGHSERAAGVVGLGKAMMQLQSSYYPLHQHFKVLNQHIDSQKSSNNFSIPVISSTLKSLSDTTSGGISSFGASGTNAHAIISQSHYLKAATRSKLASEMQPPCVIPISAKSMCSLQNYVDQFSVSASDLQSQLQIQRATNFKYRAVMSLENSECSLVAMTDPKTRRWRSEEDKSLFLFSGQGIDLTQSGKELFSTNDTFRKAQLNFNDTFHQLDTRFNLLNAVYPKITKTHQNTTSKMTSCDEDIHVQPALLSLESALTQTWADFGLKPDVIAGVSLGEYPAVLSAGIMDELSVCKLVAARVRLMTTTRCGEGRMLSVDCRARHLQQLLLGCGDPVDISAVFGPRTTTLSGERGQMLMVDQLLQEFGFRTSWIQVPYASHSRLMRSIDSELLSVGSGFIYRPPLTPFVSSLTGEQITELDANYWAQQLCNAVVFARLIETCREITGLRSFIGIGPHQTFLQFAHNCWHSRHDERDTMFLPSLSKKQAEWPLLLSSIAQLYTTGRSINWSNHVTVFNENNPIMSRSFGYRKPEYPFEKEYFWPAQIGLSRLVEETQTLALLRNMEETEPQKDDQEKGQYNLQDNSLQPEEIICRALCRVLGFPTTHKIGVEDNFFELGFNSISIVEFRNSIAQSFDMATLSVSEIRETPTVHGVLQIVKAKLVKGEIEEPTIFVEPEPLDLGTNVLPYALSHGQSRMMCVMQTHNHAIFNENILLKFDKDLEWLKLDRAMAQIIARHSALRTMFCENELNGETLQHPVSLTESRFVLAPRLMNADKVRFHLNAARYTKMSLVTKPPAIFNVFQDCEGGDNTLQCLWSHLLFDGWSLNIVLKELTEYYNGTRGSPTMPSSTAHRHFVQSEENFLRSTQYQISLEFWRQYLENIELPVSGHFSCQSATKETSNYEAKNIEFRLGTQLSDLIAHAAKRSQVTMFPVVLSAFIYALYLHNGDDDITVGTHVANRDVEKFRASVGYYGNTIPVRCNVTDTWPFSGITDTNTSICSAFRHKHIPFDCIVQACSKVAQLDVMFLLQNVIDVHNLDFSGTQSHFVIPKNDFAKFRLTCQLFSSVKTGLHGVMTYSPAHDNDRTIRSFIQTYTRTLENVCTDLSLSKTGTIQLIRPNSMVQNATIYNQLPALQDVPRHTMNAIRLESWQRYSLSISVEEHEHTWSCSHLRQKVAARSEFICQQNVAATGCSTTVDRQTAVLLGRTFESLVDFYAVMQSGHAYLPVDMDSRQERMQHVVEISGAAVKIEPNDRCSYSMNHLSRPLSLRQRQNPQDIAYTIFTSGTTGKPKGVVLSNGNLSIASLNFVKATQVFDKTRLTQAMKWTFDASFTDWMATANSGCRLRLNRTPLAALKWLKSRWPVSMHATPAMFENCPKQQLERFGASMEFLVCGGETIPRRLVDSVCKHGAKLVNAYGPTEAAVAVMTKMMKLDDQTAELGSAWAGVSAYVCRNNALAPETSAGEMILGGGTIARGYMGNPEMNKEAFHLNKYAAKEVKLKRQEGKTYCTGDLVKSTAGTYTYLGRLGDEVKLMGHRVDLTEIESVVATTEGVETAKVLTGTTNGLAAFYTSKCDVSLVALRKACSNLPHYMIPDVFIRVESIPLTANGKTDRGALLKYLPAFKPSEGMDEQEMSNLEENCVTVVANEDENHGHYFTDSKATEFGKTHITDEMSTGVERFQKQIRSIFCDVLSRTNFKDTDNFFEIGGNSYLTVRLVAAIEATLGLSVKITDVFRFTSVKKLSKHLLSQTHDDFTAIRERTKFKLPIPNFGTKDIAIISMSGRLSDCGSLDEFWKAVRNQKDCISHLPAENLLRMGMPVSVVESPNFVPAAGRVHHSEFFEPEFWGLNHTDASLIDPQIRKLLEECLYLIENSGLQNCLLQKAIGVVAGSGYNKYLAMNQGYIEQKSGFIRAVKMNMVATQISYLHSLTGPSFTIDTACSTTMVALAQACQMLQLISSDLCIVAGVSFPLCNWHGYQCLGEQDGLLSKNGHCHPFDHQAAGMVPGAGCAAILCKPAQAALQDGDQILAIIRSCATNNDGGRKASFAAPSADGQAECIQRAIGDAGIATSEIAAIECHGTGTYLGDPIEVAALAQVFTNVSSAHHGCFIGSVKANIGHCDVVAGLAGLIKAVFMLKDDLIPAQINYTAPNPHLNLDTTCFKITTVAAKVDMQYLGISSFGFGGTNAHTVLQKVPDQWNRADNVSSEMDPIVALPVSAKTDISCSKYFDALLKHIETADVDMHRVAYTLQHTRVKYSHRSCVTDILQRISSRKCESPEVRLASLRNRPIIYCCSVRSKIAHNTGRWLYKMNTKFAETIDCIFNEYRLSTGSDSVPTVYSDDDSASDITNPVVIGSFICAIQKQLQQWGIEAEDIIDDLGSKGLAFRLAAQHLNIKNCVEFLRTMPEGISKHDWFTEIMGTASKYENPILIDIAPGNLLWQVVTRAQTTNNHYDILSTMQNNLPMEPALFHTVGQLWELGWDIDWTKVYPCTAALKAVNNLPNYQFNQVRCWINAEENNIIKKSTHTDTVFYHTSWQAFGPLSFYSDRSPNYAQTSETAWLLFDRGNGVAKQLGAQLNISGASFITVSLDVACQDFTADGNNVIMNPLNENNYVRLSDYLNQRCVQLSHIVHTTLLSTEEDNLVQLHALGSKSIEWVTKHIVLQHHSDIHFALIGTGLSQMSPKNNPKRSPIMGIMGVVPVEMDWVKTCTIDLPSPLLSLDLAAKLVAIVFDNETYHQSRQLLALQGQTLFQQITSSLPPAVTQSEKLVTPEVCDSIIVLCHDGTSAALVEEILLEYRCNIIVFLNKTEAKKRRAGQGKMDVDVGGSLVDVAEHLKNSEHRDIVMIRLDFEQHQHAVAAIKGRLQKMEYPPVLLFDVSLGNPTALSVDKLEELFNKSGKEPELWYHVTSLGGVLPHRHTSYAEAMRCRYLECLAQSAAETTIHHITIAVQTSSFRARLSDRAISEAEMRQQFAVALRIHGENFVIVSKNDPTGAGGPVVKSIVLERRASQCDSILQETDASRLEAQLATFFHKTLGVQKISRKDDFFELGGESLGALQVINSIQKDRGVLLSLADLSDHPTIETLAQFLLSLAKNSAATDSNGRALVQMSHRHIANRGTIIVVHPVGGSVFQYRRLINMMPNKFDYYGLQYPNLLADSVAYKDANTIQKLAKAYLKELRAVTPKRPYILLGHSLGGTIGYEMARQLNDECPDGPAQCVIMLDSWAKFTNYLKDPGCMDTWTKQHLGYIVDGLFNCQESSAPSNIRERIREQVWKLLQMGIEYKPNSVQPTKIYLMKAIEIDEAHAGHTESEGDVDSNFWREHSSLPISVYHVPGDHISLLTEFENCTVLARGVNEVLQLENLI